MTSKMLQKLMENELGSKSTKHIENVQNGLARNAFSNRKVANKSLKPEVPTSKTKISKTGVDMKTKSIKNRSQNSTKNDA